MAGVAVYSKTGAKQERGVTLPKEIFGLAEPSHDLVSQAYRTYLANGRSAQASVLNRGDVRGGGKKPWRQKGTGRARVGSSRVPNWRGGGSVFGPTGLENYSLNMPVKMKRLAIRQALSLRNAAGAVSVIEEFTSVEGKVKPTVELLAKIKASGKIVLVVNEKNNLLERATNNVAGLKLVSATYLNVFDIMNADAIIIAQDALATVEKWLKPPKAKEARA